MIAACDAALTETDASVAVLDQSRKYSIALRQSILKSAFAGKLVAQDAADEPASVLLERIKADRERPADVALRAKPKAAKAPSRRRGRPKKAAESSDRQGKLL